MRITNQMTTNKMLLNITRNMNAVDNLYTQLTTGKKIQMPSDNPIIASRALKFRTNIAETNQYLSNVAQGISWMQITEQALSNTMESLISVKELCTEGASGNYNIDNKKTFADELQSLLAQLETEMNVTYAGRYVFSGYRTDKPPTILEDGQAVDYDITQSLTAANIEHAKVYTKQNPDAPVVSEVNKLKLPYSASNNVTMNEIRIVGANGSTVAMTLNGTTTPQLISVPAAAGTNAYNPGDDEVYYVQDTGEIILGKNAMAAVSANADGRIDLDYHITNLDKGDLNPEVYFDCHDNINNKTYTMTGQNIQYEFGVNTRVPINNMAKDSLTASLYGDLRALLNLVNGVQLTPENQLIDKYSNPPHSLQGDALTEAVQKQRAEEKQYFNGVLQNAFSNMLGIIEDHTSQASKEYTQLGSRMNRLEMIQNRLTQDRLSYETLKSENEDVDYLEATMNLNAANYVYQMALKAGGSIMQTSLADFIR